MLRTREVLPDSTNKNYLAQTEVLATYVRNDVFRGMEIPADWQAAIVEFEAQRDELASLMKSDWKEAARRLSELALNQMARRTLDEALFNIQTSGKRGDTYELANRWDWTNTRSSSGRLVGVGRADAWGANVVIDGPRGADDDLGVSFSRSLYSARPAEVSFLSAFIQPPHILPSSYQPLLEQDEMRDTECLSSATHKSKA